MPKARAILDARPRYDRPETAPQVGWNNLRRVAERVISDPHAGKLDTADARDAAMEKLDKARASVPQEERPRSPEGRQLSLGMEEPPKMGQGELMFSLADKEMPEHVRQRYENWNNVKKGDQWNSVKKFIPLDGKLPEPMNTRGSIEEVSNRAADFLRANPKLKAKDGRIILVANPENGTIEGRGKHLVAPREKEDGMIGAGEREIVLPSKAAMVTAIPETLVNADSVVKQGRDILYFKGYLNQGSKGVIHLVVTDNYGRMLNQESYDGSIITQYTPEPQKRFEGATVLLTEKRPVPERRSSRQNPDGEMGPQQGDQTGVGPTTPAHQNNTPSSGEFKASLQQRLDPTRELTVHLAERMAAGEKISIAEASRIARTYHEGGNPNRAMNLAKAIAASIGEAKGGKITGDIIAAIRGLEIDQHYALEKKLAFERVFAKGWFDADSRARLLDQRQRELEAGARAIPADRLPSAD